MSSDLVSSSGVGACSSSIASPSSSYVLLLVHVLQGPFPDVRAALSLLAVSRHVSTPYNGLALAATQPTLRQRRDLHRFSLIARATLTVESSSCLPTFLKATKRDAERLKG